MRGIQVSKMYGYNDVDPVFDEMRRSSFEPPEIDYTKEDSDIYVGRLFKDKAQFKLTMVIYALAKVCRFKLRHCKHFITAKCVSKQCSSWRVHTQQYQKQQGQTLTILRRSCSLGTLDPQRPTFHIDRRISFHVDQFSHPTVDRHPTFIIDRSTSFAIDRHYTAYIDRSSVAKHGCDCYSQTGREWKHV
ncbi:hypothetical protein F2Q70_00029711 [Brassica cretica]|uniref:Transposase MuDR plant domain-containing protein n=1 Tax=Brassica cretica TaxID=69181 RepID=A0A8S9FKK5_BRACR|nr:hypothetical protein F2Q70_00029711 [Brassica cretica]